MLKRFLCLLLSMFILSSCDVSFPQETIERDAIDLIKKETQTDTKVYRYGSTLYLDVCFEDLISDDKEKIIDIYDKIQKIVSNIVRVPLSSDAKIDFVVVSAFDPEYQTLLRLVENIDDIKLYSHQMISREDFSDRQLMEFEGPENVKETVDNKYDVSKEEYVARLIVSQLINSSRSNPFLAKLMQFVELKFSDIEDDKMCFILKREIEKEEVKNLLETILKREINKYIQKYKLFSIKSAILKDEKNNIVFNVPVKV